MKNIVVVDIDGTIAKVGDRLKYLRKEPKDYDSFFKGCGNDKPIVEVITLVQALADSGKEIVFCTGRNEVCREETLKWLKRFFTESLVAKCLLLMRGQKDYRHDAKVKPELLQKAAIPLHAILLILEDRKSVVKKWREFGVVCLQVADGDF